MPLVFQGVALNVFEPRYRLMVRRCLDGDRRFGMLGSADPHTPDEGEGHGVGSEVEIKDSRQLHDGRYHIQVRPCPSRPLSVPSGSLHVAWSSWALNCSP